MADIHHGTLVANVVTTEVIDAYMVQITVQVRNSNQHEIYCRTRLGIVHHSGVGFSLVSIALNTSQVSWMVVEP